MKLREKLFHYVEKFNMDDEELYIQDIDNAHAFTWLEENIPYFECPDKTLEEIYYFRWWVFRKHIKSTEDGYVITEFLPPVPWAGKHNSIIYPVEHHIAEARWLKSGGKVIEDYALLWLEEKSRSYDYSTALLYAIYKYCQLKNDYSFGMEHLNLMIRFYEKNAEMFRCGCGLFCRVDGEDGGEFSISGRPVPKLNAQKGIRPILNSYMAANAQAIAEFAKRAGKQEIASKYEQEAERIRGLMLRLLWDGAFFKAVHGEDVDNLPDVKELPAEQNVKELQGYIPWCYDIVPQGQGYEKAFEELKDEKGFKSRYGLTTAEQRHPRFLYEANHECLWNGYIWPNATSTVLNAVINLLDHYDQDVITEEDFRELLCTYAENHYLVKDNGKKVCWIDEAMDPRDGDWSCRTIQKNCNWTKGGYERGKDYNHSTFCDLVIRGLLGVKCEEGILTVRPRIPEDWEYVRLENLWIGGECYEIVYDKDGTRYGQGKGLKVTKKT